MKENLEPLIFNLYNTKEHNNIQFEFSEFTFEKDVLNFDKEYDGDINDYYSLIKNDNKIKMYYRAGNLQNRDVSNMKHEECTKYQVTCYAESEDGINFNKPNLQIINYNNDINNNIILKENYSHNFCPYYDEKNKNYLALVGTKFDTDGLLLLKSSDGLIWNEKTKILDTNHIRDGWKHSNHFDSLNCLLYNPIEDIYNIYVRDNQIKYPFRRIQLSKSKNLIDFDNCIEVNINFNNLPKRCIYHPGIFIYPKNNYFISLTAFSTNDDLSCKEKSTTIMISKDGINFELLKYNLFNLNSYQIIANRFVLLNDKFYFYINCRENIHSLSILKCYSVLKDRIAFLKSDSLGTFQSKDIRLNSLDIFINFKTKNNGFIILELYNLNNELVTKSNNIIGDDIRRKVIWVNEENIILNKQYYFKFLLDKAIIYSFSYY